MASVIVINKTTITLSKDDNVYCISKNDKPLYSFRGDVKYVVNKDKKGNTLSVVFKIRDKFNHIYYIAFNETDNYMRNSISTISSFLVKFAKDEKDLIKRLEKL